MKQIKTGHIDQILKTTFIVDTCNINKTLLKIKLNEYTK